MSFTYDERKSLDCAKLSKPEWRRLRREMLKQAKLMLKGSRMTAGQISHAARQMVDQALARERAQV